MSPARLSALDAAFRSLESAEAPMHVGRAAVFAPPATARGRATGHVLHPPATRVGPAAAALGEAIAPARPGTSFDRLVDSALLARWGARPIGRAGALDALPLRHSGVASLAGVRARRPCRISAG
jgi:hypothetical protein